MGHITVDRLEDAWRKLNKAEHLAEEGQTHAAVLECENALQEAYKSADGMGFGVWFAGKENDIRNRLSTLKRETKPDEAPTVEQIEETKSLVKTARDKIIPELHTRIDYEPTPNFEKFE